MALLNKNGEGGVISSETLNLTRITTVLRGGVAAITASGFDWTGFNQVSGSFWWSPQSRRSR